MVDSKTTRKEYQLIGELNNWRKEYAKLEAELEKTKEDRNRKISFNARLEAANQRLQDAMRQALDECPFDTGAYNILQQALENKHE